MNLKRNLLSWLDWMLGTTNVGDYDHFDKAKAIEEANHQMNRTYINQLHKEANRAKRANPQDYDINYTNTLESLAKELKTSKLEDVRKRAKHNMLTVWKNHSTKVLAYNYFLSLRGV